MTALLKLSPLARGLTTLYASALLAGMWSMIVPAIPVLATSFGISPGTAAQITITYGINFAPLTATASCLRGPDPVRDTRPPRPPGSHSVAPEVLPPQTASS